MPALRAPALLKSAALAALIFSTAESVLAQRQPRPPQPALVEEVNITGNRRTRREDLLFCIQTRPGDPFDEAQVIRDFQTLMSLGLFNRRGSRVVTETGPRGGVVVIFEVQELPVIASVKFEGLSRGDEGPLLEGLRRRRLEVVGGNVYEPDKIARAMEAIKELLRGRGWRGVGVQARTSEVSSTSVELTFVVTGQPPKKRSEPKRLDRPVRRPDAIA